MKVKMSRKLMTAAAAVLIISMVSASPLNAESVFLKDGSIVEGSIISDSAAFIKVKDKDNKIKQLPRNEILRVRYTKLKMGKIYIQKRDGEGIVAFIVDEDQDSYTFRKELLKPDEFTLNRGDILFMAEKNPSGLKTSGDIETDRVSLTWLPPYDSVKKYNIYLTKDKKNKFELADSTNGKSITIKNLSSNTAYFLIVTSIDSDGYESSPSNELKITTKNRPPSEPVIISSGDMKATERTVMWDASNDPDGKIAEYRIYVTADDKREMIAEIKKTEFILKNALSYDKVEIAAVDDRGDESEYARVRILGDSTFLGFYPGMIYPMGKFGKMYNPGYGGMFTFSGRNLLFINSEVGISLGYYYLQGKDLLDEKNKDYLSYMLIPLYLTAGYNIGIGESFCIKPVISLGSAYVDARYKDALTGSSPDKNLKEIFPSLKIGLYADYKFTNALSFSVACEHGTVFENGGRLSFIQANAGIAYSF